ncbi:DUF3219 family protein [Planomicrobium sp. YIM 101495]|uniref:DUF3219 family protein n=1 Tax=Planomicrobium sp. YIM 101495 TaxID=2665160 RepID=UPI0012B7A5BB|nr:DUF3219 family protein [Planomicrobium sp. YIM 101495]MTD31420.1 DUF3219 family protein [Planomicrobium sp. YIM 101495]
MTIEIWLNDRKFEAVTFEQETNPPKIRFDFKVTSEEYHDVAVLLYEMEFQVRVPDREFAFIGRITNYITSRTNLYEPGNVADYHLELTAVE